MKESPATRRKIDSGPPAAHRSRRGIALVVVLIFLVLLTVLVLAFFSSVTNEYTASKTYANEVSTQFLSDSAVNVVMGQIAKGTSGTLNGTTRLTWASQPGMIRTWDDQGYAEDCYKLYSAGSMVITGSVVQSGSGAVLSALQADVPTTWSSQPAIYTDLNAPVTDSSGAVNFPIIDGNGMSTVSVSGSNGSPMSVLTYWHQIPGKPRSPSIEGFYVQPTYVPNYNASGSLTSTNTPVPMPVAWLYVLKDGTIISPDPGGSGTAATFTSGTIQPSTTNPIVGRIAFWTDDETCKLNINTASEGTYYAMPRANTPTDMVQAAKTSGSTAFGFAVSPPATNEYNRYPGHPAATCLSVAMGTWLNLSTGTTAPNAYTSTTSDQVYLTSLTNYLTMLPRSGTGGSEAGTVCFTGTGFQPVITSTNRLFASFDELMFNPSRQPNPTATGTLTKTELEELKFFLTASSRAPELTPFNTPKVSLWPQWFTSKDRQNYQGPTQQLMAFCSSFGTAASGSSASGKNEYFWEWYSSVAKNSSGNFASTSSCDSSLDWTGVPRNQQLATYLCNLGNHPIPGYGVAFRSAGKYSDRCFSNIVLECLDYIRSCIARCDYQQPASVVTSSGISESTQEYWWIAPLMISDSILPGVSSTNPIKGFGYFPIFPEVVMGVGLSCSGSTPTPFLAFNVFTAPWSFPAGQQNMTASITGWNNLGISGTSPNNPIPINRRVQSVGGDWYEYGRNLPFHVYVADCPGCSFTTSGTASVTMGGSQPVQISFTDGTGRAFQTMSVTFPVVTVPTMPTKVSTYMKNNMSNQDGAGDWLGSEVEPYYGGGLFQPGHSVARGMECNAATAAKGDWRILGGAVYASSDSAPGGSGTTGNLFSQVAGYTGTTAQVHTLRVWGNNGTQPIIDGTTATTSIVGTLAPVVSGAPILSSTDYGGYVAPFAPQGMLGAMNINNLPGDWDTGAGVFPDGPYINVVDQVDNPNPSVYYPSNSAWSGYGAGFTPNKRIASAIQFGSLPTGVSASPPRPWETLLFCPNPAARNSSNMPIGTSQPLQNGNIHIGFANPPDHLFLQFFTLPVVQPYAISEPLSTAGKVNLNYQLAPFTNIERSTALRGVLKNTLLTGISGYDVKTSGTNPMYKSNPAVQGQCYSYDIRYDINRDATIAGIEEHYFDQGQIFRYPSEICDVFLVPQKLPGATYNPSAMAPPTTYDSMLDWWNPTGSSPDPLAVMGMTGDNLREEPYDRIYPRLTTQSNTYTVHCRVQTLKKRTGSNQAEWDEGLDVVTAEYRGSSLIERYIDPADPALNSNWDNDTISLNLSGTNHADLSTLYKFRVISTKKFAP